MHTILSNCTVPCLMEYETCSRGRGVDATGGQGSVLGTPANCGSGEVWAGVRHMHSVVLHVVRKHGLV